MLDAYVAAGWALVRIPPLSKAPKDHDWPDQDYPPSVFRPGDNVGVILGPRSGGLVDVDCDCPEAIALAPSFLPPTATFGRHGFTKTPAAVPGLPTGTTRHYLYTCPAVTKTTKWNQAHLELRGPGGQTVLPPSIRGVDMGYGRGGKSGGDPPGEVEQPIFWTSSTPVQPITEAELHRAVGMLGAAVVIARAWPKLEGGRHDAALALAGALHGEGWSQEDAEKVILEAAALTSPDTGHRAGAIRSTFENDDRNRTGWPTLANLMGEGAKALQKSVNLVPKTRIEVLTSGPAPELGALSDTGNAERLGVLYHGRLRYGLHMGWLRWDGTRWRKGTEPVWEAVESARYLAGHARASGLKTVVEFATASESSKALSAAVRIASHLPSLVVEADDLDADPFLLNTPAGTIDLRTGQLRAHDPNDLITQVTAVAPGGSCPRFVQFLHECMGGDQDLVLYLLRWMGYCLTGSTAEHVLGLWHGPSGANGKTTLLDALLRVMGDYGRTLSPDVLLAGPSQHATVLMDLRGRRLVCSDETPEGKRWNESLVKRLTGGGRMTARGIAKDPVEFTMTHKLLIATNARPLVREQGSAFWRRMHCVPWMVNFAGREDRYLPDKLAAEAPGILSLLVAGCLDWQAHGTSPPVAVTAASGDYRASQDIIGEFLGEHTERGPDAWCNRTDLYRRYAHWAMGQNEHVYPASAFFRVLEERGLRTAIRKGTRGFAGIRLLVTDALRAVTG